MSPTDVASHAGSNLARPLSSGLAASEQRHCEKHPHGKHAQSTQRMHHKAVDDAIVGDVNESVYRTERDVTPGKDYLKRRNQVRDRQGAADCVEKNRHLKEVAEIV